MAQAQDEFADLRMADLPSQLRAGDLLVVNDSRVVSARLSGVRTRGEAQARIEATLHKRLGPDRWAAFARPAKRLAAGDAIAFGGLSAQVAQTGEAGEVILAFDQAGAALDAAVERAGQMPLPPYIAGKRAPDEADRADYQTLFARDPGSVAAPTAGLHFTPELTAALEVRGVGLERVTLHVGAGTFLPVKADRIEDHRMHAETGEVSDAVAERIARTRAEGGRIVCVGTTSLRLLESAADEEGRVRAFRGDTDIFIRPGGRPVRTADGLLTNFHLPRSTLLMLVAAFAGLDTMRAGYRHALAGDYRFYSYGDASLWWRRP
jgi:S-adenosylmethionine:tRNA ribosyltransferase-isomerase